jgi:hypothetical protein
MHSLHRMSPSADIFNQPIIESPFDPSLVHSIKETSLDSWLGESILTIIEGRLERAVFLDRSGSSDLGTIVEKAIKCVRELKAVLYPRRKNQSPRGFTCGLESDCSDNIFGLAQSTN